MDRRRPAEVEVTRLAVVVSFTITNWYVQQEIEPRGRPVLRRAGDPRGLDVVPGDVSPALEAARPTRRRGGVTADRSLKTGVKLPGELTTRCSRSDRSRRRVSRSTS